MEWAVLGIFVFALLMVYGVWQGARAQIKYRQEIHAGNIAVIQEVVSSELERWRLQRPPRQVPLAVWNSVRAMEISSLGVDHIHVSCIAEGQYRLIEGHWQEVSSPLHEGMAVAAKAIEMLLYDIPHFRPRFVRVDIYTTYRDPNGFAERAPILTCSTDREDARDVDWDNTSPKQIVDVLNAHYQITADNRVVPIELAEEHGILGETFERGL